MSENTRVKELRKALDLTMEKFGERLGVKKSTISDIENNRRNVTEHMLKTICLEYDVNDVWLRTGQGEMFNQRTKKEHIAHFIGSILAEKNELDAYKVELISFLSLLNEEQWKSIIDLGKSWIDLHKNS